ncbi:MAG: hypothetical protein KUG73_08390 [Pseudomonadales bacterium]|nr:hypothetical protein [Pseudomonadales bacterium]
MTDFRSLIVSIMLVSSIMIMAYVGGVYIEGSVDFITIEVQSNDRALGWMLVKT